MCPFHRTTIPKTTALFHWYMYHAKTYCTFCMNVVDDRYPDRKKGSLSQIKTTSSWQAFDCNTVLLTRS